MAAVRELVTKITFKTDNASLNRTKDAIENLKRSLQNLGGGLDSSLSNSLNGVRRNITQVSMSIRNLRRQMQGLGNISVNPVRNTGGGNNHAAQNSSSAGLLNAIRNLRVGHADRVYIKGNIQGRNGGGGDNSPSPNNPRGGNGGGGLSEVGAGLGLPVGIGVGGAAAAGILALGAGVTKAVNDFMDFDATMSKVQAISGATGEQMKELEKTARNLGATTQYSAKEAADGMTFLAMAGWKTEQIISGMPGLLSLAAASGEDLATVADIVSDDLTAFHMTADKAGHFSDVLAVASSNANTNVAMMGETFKYVGSVAGALGYSIEDSALAVGLMANAGIKSTMAGTALRSTMTRLIAPPKTAAAALDELGFSTTTSEGKLKSFREQIVELRGKFKDLTQAEQAEYAQQIAGQEAMSGFLALMTASEADFNKLANQVDHADGAAEKMAKTMNDNLSGSLKQFGSAAAEAGLKVGKFFEPAVRSVIDSMTEAIGKSDNFFSVVDKLAGFDFGSGKNLAEFNKRQKEYEKLAKENPMAARVAGWERSRRKAAQLHELGQGNSTASIERYNQTYSQVSAEDPQAIKMLWVWQQLEAQGERIGGLFGGLKDIFSNLFSGMLEGIEEFSPLFGAAMALFESGLADLGAAWATKLLIKI